MPTIYCTIYIVRHGQTDWNVKRLIQGHRDIPLNQIGEQQAMELGKKLKQIHFDAVFSSDLLRAKRTAEIISLERQIAIQTTKALRERHFGSFQGKSADELGRKMLQKLIKEFSLLPVEEQKKYGNFESTEKYTDRFLQFLREVAVAYEGKTILVVTHGGPMKYLLDHLGFWNGKAISEFSIKNTAYIKLESDGIDFFIKETFGIEQKNYPPKIAGR